MSAYQSSYGQPIVTLGVPEHDVVGRAMTWVLVAVSLIFLFFILAFAIINADDGSAASEENALASGAVATAGELG